MFKSCNDNSHYKVNFIIPTFPSKLRKSCVEGSIHHHLLLLSKHYQDSESLVQTPVFENCIYIWQQKKTILSLWASLASGKARLEGYLQQYLTYYGNALVLREIRITKFLYAQVIKGY